MLRIQSNSGTHASPANCSLPQSHLSRLRSYILASDALSYLFVFDIKHLIVLNMESKLQSLFAEKTVIFLLVGFVNLVKILSPGPTRCKDA